jgi:hypothetical protein
VPSVRLKWYAFAGSTFRLSTVGNHHPVKALFLPALSAVCKRSMICAQMPSTAALSPAKRGRQHDKGRNLCEHVHELVERWHRPSSSRGRIHQGRSHRYSSDPPDRQASGEVAISEVHPSLNAQQHLFRLEVSASSTYCSRAKAHSNLSARCAL